MDYESTALTVEL